VEHSSVVRPKRYRKDRKCSQCGGARETAHRWCRACKAAWARKNRRRHSDLTIQERRAANARSYANVYQRRGKLKKLPCRRCGDQKAEKHHEDYGKPLEVIWLCRFCHLSLHRAAVHGVPSAA
jgi:hypothetical protein